MNRFFTAACLLVLGLSTPTSGAAAQGDSATPSMPKGLHAPARVGSYVRGEAHDFGSATMGVSYQYKPDEGSDSSYATVYFYDREADERTWPADSLARATGAAFRKFLDIARDRGDYDSYNIAFEERDSVTIGGVVFPGYQVAYIYRRGSATAVSFLYVYVVNQSVVKVRGTVPVTHWQETELPIFARAVARAAFDEGGSSAPDKQ